jgi:nicotinamide riboside kinase
MSDGSRRSCHVRIYFVGSHATGKTTLCRYVSQRYGLPMISEVARAVLAEMETGLNALRTDMDLVAEYQERVFARQVAVEKMHHGRFVSDRAFDNLAYVAEHTTNAAAMMNDQRFRDYMQWVAEGVVFFLRPHQSLLKDDGVRAGVSWDSVLRIDGMVKLMLEQYRISYLPIESVSMQERVRAVEFVPRGVTSAPRRTGRARASGWRRLHRHPRMRCGRRSSRGRTRSPTPTIAGRDRGSARAVQRGSKSHEVLGRSTNLP